MADLRDGETRDDNSHAGAVSETLANADAADLEKAGIDPDGGTVEDWYGVEAPASVDGVDLLDADKCPVCECTDTFFENPAGYYHCDRCFSTWAGDVRDAEIVDYLEWTDDDQELVTDGGRPTCTDPTCNDVAEYAYWMPDMGDFSRARAPESPDLEDGDLCPYVCASCRDWRISNGRYDAERFVDPRERLVTDGGTVEPATTQQTLTPTDDTPEPRPNSALEREWNDLRKHADVNHESRPWEITHTDHDTDADRAYELLVSWTTNFCMAAHAAYEWDRFNTVWVTTESEESR